MFGHRPNCNQTKFCVLGFSANRVWLVSRFYIFEVPAIGSGRASIVDMVDTFDAYFIEILKKEYMVRSTICINVAYHEIS